MDNRLNETQRAVVAAGLQEAYEDGAIDNIRGYEHLPTAATSFWLDQIDEMLDAPEVSVPFKGGVDYGKSSGTSRIEIVDVPQKTSGVTGGSR